MASATALNTTHPHLRMVRDVCNLHNQEPVEFPGGMKVYPYFEHMTVFSNGKKAYAVSGMSNPFKKLWDGQVRDISKTTPRDIGGLGAVYGDSISTLQEGKALTPEECKALWKEMGFSDADVLRLIGKHLPNNGALVKKALEGVGLNFKTRDEAKYAFEDAGLFGNTSVDRIIDEMYA